MAWHGPNVEGNPVFTGGPLNPLGAGPGGSLPGGEARRLLLMFYIGYRDIDHAQIGLARSKDGITGWQRHPGQPDHPARAKNKWDHDACYKPYAIFDGGKWLLWYNGRHGGLEQIGLATHRGEDLGFPPNP